MARFPDEKYVKEEMNDVLKSYDLDEEYQAQVRTKVPLKELPKRHVITVDQKTYNSVRNKAHALGLSIGKAMDDHFIQHPVYQYDQRPENTDRYAFLWEQEYSKIVDIEPFLSKKEAEKAFKKAQSMEEYEEILERLKASNF